MEKTTILGEDKRIIRVDNLWWSIYIDTKLAPGLDRAKCGKWIFFFSDIEFAKEICREAVLGKVVAECKHSSSEALVKNGSGVAYFYLNSDDVAYRRVIAFMLEHNLVRKTKSGKLYNIGFKLDDQTRAGEYAREICIGNSDGSSLNARICRSAEYLYNCDEKFAASESLLAKEMGISVEALNEVIEVEGAQKEIPDEEGEDWMGGTLDDS